MQYTSNYGLSKPESSDRYLIDVLNSNADLLDALFGGIRIAPPMTQAQYDAMESHNASTLYIVLDTEEEEVSE